MISVCCCLSRAHPAHPLTRTAKVWASCDDGEHTDGGAAAGTAICGAARAPSGADHVGLSVDKIVLAADLQKEKANANESIGNGRHADIFDVEEEFYTFQIFFLDCNMPMISSGSSVEVRSTSKRAQQQPLHNIAT